MRITIDINCTRDTCGECRFHSWVDGCKRTKHWCSIFDSDLYDGSYNELPKDFPRLDQCIEATVGDGS